MKLSKLEESLLFSLTLVSVLMAANIIAGLSGIDFSFLDQFINIVFYFLALFVPLYMFVQWMKKSTNTRLLKVIIAMIPALLFAGFALITNTL